MCAGRGIIHAEMPVHAEGQPDPRGLQLWVDLPKKVCSLSGCSVVEQLNHFVV
jgi:redox-sensitive bicupin YhaK (pirin superfamily)